MKKTAWILMIITSVVVVACENSSDETQFVVSNNDRSELAELMFAMYEDAAAMKLQINAGKTPTAALDYDDMLSAEGTEPEKVKSIAYDIFSESFLSTLEALETCEPEQADSLYTVFVRSCETCHAAMCPGPLKKIKNLHEL